MVQVTVKKGTEEKSYKLEDLLELQNKLMLMSSKGEHGREQVNRFSEVSGIYRTNKFRAECETFCTVNRFVRSRLHVWQVFEGVQRLGTILLQMQTSGNMLFREWQTEIHCCPQQQVCIKVSFLSLMGQELLYYGEVTEQLRRLARSMDNCQSEWCSFIGEMRSNFYLLNHYTSEQIVFLCHWIHKVCQRPASLPPQIGHLLFPIKPHCTLNDVRVAYANAVSMASEQDKMEDAEDHQDPDSMDLTPASPESTEEEMEEAHDLMEFSSEDEADVVTERHDGSIRKHGEDNLETLWQKFKNNMSQCLQEYLDISTLAYFLSCLSEMNQQHMVRNLPLVLQEGKPNLVLCPSAELFITTLSFYTASPEQPLPSTDEVLVCREETTEEEVELFLRRALGHSSKHYWKKIYSLVNPGLLGYDVSVAVEGFFEDLQRSANPHYRLVIVSPVVHQHRYVPSLFSNYKLQVGVSPTAEVAKNYLHQHFTQKRLPQNPVAQVSPGHLSVWVVSSVRPAVGKCQP